MKHEFPLTVLVACTLFLSACDPIDIFGELTGALLGNVELTVSSTQPTFYDTQDTVKFSSSIGGEWIKEGNPNILALAANINLTEANVLPYPYLGVLVNDSAVGTYTVSDALVSLEDVINLNINELLTNSDGKNLFVIAATDTCWYLPKSGTINVTSMPKYGGEIAATFNNVQAYYITESMLDYVRDLFNQVATGDITAAQTLAQLQANPTSIAPVVTFNGTMASRRITVSTLLNMLIAK